MKESWMRDWEVVDLLGLPVARVGVDEVHSFIRKVISERSKALILNVNIHCVCLALKQAWLADFLRGADLVFCDGDGVRWGVRILGDQPPPKIAFTRWIWSLAGFCTENRYRVFFLGAKPGVAEEAARRLKLKYPQFEVVGTRHGYFDLHGEENELVIEEINRVKPDLLVVCLGMPRQERWLYENWARIEAHIFLPGGGVFDNVSGHIGDPPAWMIRFQLEWLYTVWRQPRRFRRYATEIPYFFYRVFLEKMKRVFTSRRSQVKPPGSS